MAECNAGQSRGLLECVEIDDHHVDGGDAVSGDGGFMFLVAANVEQAAVDLGVQRFDAAVKHLRKACQLGDVLDRKTRRAQCRSGSAS